MNYSCLSESFGRLYYVDRTSIERPNAWDLWEQSWALFESVWNSWHVTPLVLEPSVPDAEMPFVGGGPLVSDGMAPFLCQRQSSLCATIQLHHLSRQNHCPVHFCSAHTQTIMTVNSSWCHWCIQHPISRLFWFDGSIFRVPYVPSPSITCHPRPLELPW